MRPRRQACANFSRPLDLNFSRRDSGARLNGLVFVGIAMGFLIGNAFRLIPCTNIAGPFQPPLSSEMDATGHRRPGGEPDPQTRLRFCTDQNLIFVGVMTAKEFLASRVAAVNNTWAKDFPGKVVYFAAEGADSADLPGIELVALKGTDDTYPPQKKAFLMLKYMHDHYLDRYRFFLRADDDVYVKGDELVKFLHSVKTTGKTPVIGSSGQGDNEIVEKLFKRKNKTYCMGGPGIIIAREVLRKTAPNVKQCLKNLYTTHEDVEIGRCIQQFANVSCVWNARDIFYQNYKDLRGSFNHTLRGIRGILEALTLHSIKAPSYVYRLHQHLLTAKATGLHSRLQNLSRDADDMRALLGFVDASQQVFRDAFAKYGKMKDRRDVDDDDDLRWNFISDFYHSPSLLNPKLHLPQDLRDAMNDTGEKIWEKFHSQDIREKNIAFLYSRRNLLRGHDFILTISKNANKRDKSVPKRRLFYVHRKFRPIELTEDNRTQGATGEPVNQIKIEAVRHEHVVNVVVRLGESYESFTSFMEDFEKFHLKSRQNVSLTILLVRSRMDDAIISHVNRLLTEYFAIGFTVKIIDTVDRLWFRNFIEHFNDADLLLFVDDDMLFLPVMLQRARLNTVRGQTAYLPNVYNPFDALNVLLRDASSHASIVAAPTRCNGSHTCQEFGHGMALSIYKEDLVRAVSSQEIDELDLLEKIILSHVSIVRSTDDGLKYRFHADVCNLSCVKRSKMCLNRTNVSAISSIDALSELIYGAPYLFDRSKT